MSTIEERVKKIIGEQLGVKQEEVTNNASFVEDLGADSLDTVELVMALEEEFDTFSKGGVDPAARDYILGTILSNYSEEASVLLSTHLIADIERVLDEVVFIREGVMVLHKDVDAIREETGKSVDTLFREVFAC